MTTMVTIARVRSLAAEGHTLAYIADALNRDRTPTPSGFAGTRWHRETVRRLARQQRIDVAGVAR